MDFMTVKKIKKVVAEYFNVDVLMFDDPTREQPVTTYRHIAMWFSKHYSDNSLHYIGAFFGGRDHSTVIQAITNVNDMIDTSANYREMIFELKEKIETILEINQEEGI